MSDVDRPDGSDFAIGVAGWMKDDSCVLLYDQSDIWKVDLSDASKPVNLTAGFGLKNNINFHIAAENPKKEYAANYEILRVAFNNFTKKNDFYKKNISIPFKQILLTINN